VDDILSLLIDGDLSLSSLDPNDFPGISPSVQVHDGFLRTHASSAKAVLAAVQLTLTNMVQQG
jgi:hypothetical protein